MQINKHKTSRNARPLVSSTAMCTLAPAPVKAEAARPLVRDLQFGPILEDADSVLPAGWSMHEEFRYYTCCEQGRALFAHPWHLCSVL